MLREEGGNRVFTVRSVRDHAGRLLVRFAELADRAGAEAARGTLLIAAVEADEQLAEHGEFYDRQLIGLRATTPDGAEVGRVGSVLHLPAQDVLEIETPPAPGWCRSWRPWCSMSILRQAASPSSMSQVCSTTGITLMKIDIVSIFVEYFQPLRLSLVGKAVEKGIVDLRFMIFATGPLIGTEP